MSDRPMNVRKVAGWVSLSTALGGMIFGDFGATTVLSSLARSFAAMGLLAIGLVMVGA